MLNDVTERKQAEERVRQEQSISDSLIQSLPGVFYLLDARRRLLR
jgi:PAS domain-containing protein